MQGNNFFLFRWKESENKKIKTFINSARFFELFLCSNLYQLVFLLDVSTYAVQFMSSIGNIRHNFEKKGLLFRNLFNFLKRIQPLQIYAKSIERVPANIYLFKVKNRNTRKRCEVCSESKIETLELRHWICTVVLLLILNLFTFFCSVSIVGFLNK